MGCFPRSAVFTLDPGRREKGCVLSLKPIYNHHTFIASIITVPGEGFYPLKMGKDTISTVLGEGLYPLKMGRGRIQLNRH